MLSHEQAKTLLECIEQAQEREGDWLVALEQAQGLAAMIVADTEPHPADDVSYAPCITGKIEIGDTTTEFMLTMDAGWSQWGATTPVLGERVDLMDSLGSAWTEWASENICTECQDAIINDGEGYDGKCGNCADKEEEEEE